MASKFKAPRGTFDVLPAQQTVRRRIEETARRLVEGFPEETSVYPGHMGITTLGAEKASNPFLAELAR